MSDDATENEQQQPGGVAGATEDGRVYVVTPQAMAVEGPPAPQADRSITVRQGRATFLIEPAVRHVLTGAVGASGDVRMADSLDRTIATTGIFANDRFQGEHRNGLCSYTVLMNKAG